MEIHLTEPKSKSTFGGSTVPGISPHRLRAVSRDAIYRTAPNMRIVNSPVLYRSFFLLLLILFSAVQNGTTQSFTKENLVKDIDDYKNKIIKNHAHPFNYIRKEQFLDSVNLLKSKAPAMNLDELQVAFTRLNSLLLDPHTSIGFPKENFFPVSIYLFDDGIYLLASSIKYSKHLGSRILAINDIPVDTVLSVLKCLIGTNNQSWIKQSLSGLLTDPGTLCGMHIIPTKDSVPITLVNEKDTSRLIVYSENQYSFELQSFQPEQLMLRAGSRQNYWYQYIAEKKSLYIQYRSCFEIPERPFAKFQENVLEELHSSKPERVIIDVRSNSGGSIKVFLPLIKVLARDSVRKAAKVSVLTGRRTFSAAIWNTFEMKNQLNATLIGEETGGDLNHPGAVVSFTLKHSKIKVYYSNYDFYLDATVKGGILPDIYVRHYWADYKKGLDADLEKAFTY